MTDDTTQFIDRRTNHWFSMQDAVIDHMKLEPYTLALYTVICRYANMSGGAFPSYNTLVEKSGMSRSAVIKHLDLLANKHRLIQITPRQRDNGGTTTNLYELLDPPMRKKEGGGTPDTPGGVHQVHPIKYTNISRLSLNNARPKNAAPSANTFGTPRESCIACGQQFEDATEHLHSHFPSGPETPPCPTAPTHSPRPATVDCAHCGQQVVMAQRINRDDSVDTICPNCKKQPATTDNVFADKNATATPPAFPELDALGISGVEWDILAYAHATQDRTANVPETLLNYAEGLVERGYLARTSDRSRYTLTRVGEQVKAQLPDSARLWAEISIESDRQRADAQNDPEAAAPPRKRGKGSRGLAPEIRRLFDELCAQFGGIPEELTDAEFKFRCDVAWELKRAGATPEDVITIKAYAESAGWQNYSIKICATHLNDAREWQRKQQAAQTVTIVTPLAEDAPLDITSGIL